jgi:molecular chaperone GrpE (heat shock protein)
MMESGEHKIATADAGIGQCAVEDAESSGLLELEVERLRDELAAERGRGLRTLAEFDNYRRRIRRERADAEQAGKRDILLALLDVMDVNHHEECDESRQTVFHQPSAITPQHRPARFMRTVTQAPQPLPAAS